MTTTSPSVTSKSAKQVIKLQQSNSPVHLAENSMHERPSQNQSVEDSTPQMRTPRSLLKQSAADKYYQQQQRQQPLINIQVAGIEQTMADLQASPQPSQQWSPRNKKPMFQAGILFQPQKQQHVSAQPAASSGHGRQQNFLLGSGQAAHLMLANGITDERFQVIDSITTQMITNLDDEHSGEENEDGSPTVIGSGGLTPGANIKLVPTMTDFQIMAERKQKASPTSGKDADEEVLHKSANDLPKKPSAAKSPESKDNGQKFHEKVDKEPAKSKSILSTKLNLAPVLAAQTNNSNFANMTIQSSMNTTPENTARRKQLDFVDPPPMSSRRRQMNMLTPQQTAIRNQINNLCTTSETQPIFHAIWKVVLTSCFEPRALKAHMLKANLITVPIRALHYNEILCLFKKAHGPILNVKKAEDLTASAELKKTIAEVARKKGKTVTATDTVQGFVNYRTFCGDIVRMIGDAVLLVRPQVYSLILQLLFEAVSLVYRTAKGEDVIYLRRITDIQSPFENSVTDNLPVHKIFRLNTLSIVVKYFCIQEMGQEELQKLVERRFVPRMLKSKGANGDFLPASQQQFDDVDKVIKHSHWKDKRPDNTSSVFKQSPSRSPDNRGDSTLLNASAINKILHKSKISRTVTFPTPSNFNDIESPAEKRSVQSSEEDAEVKQEDNANMFSNMQPKLPVSHTPQTIQLRGVLGSGVISPLNQQPYIDDVNPTGKESNQYHVKAGGQLAPRTPQAYQSRSTAGQESVRVSQKTYTNQTMDFNGSNKTEQFSFQNAVSNARPVTNEIGKRQVAPSSTFKMTPDIHAANPFNAGGDVSPKSSAGPVIDETFEKARHGLDQPLKLLDVMSQNNKYRMLSFMNKTLQDANNLGEIKNFGVQRAMFEKMRARAAAYNKDDPQFNIKINSQGKMEEFKDDIQPIDEMGEFINDLSKEKLIDEEDVHRGGDTLQPMDTLRIDPNQELFDFKQLLNQSFKRPKTGENDGFFAVKRQAECESPRSLASPLEDILDEQMQADDFVQNRHAFQQQSLYQKTLRSTTLDPMNIRQKFNSKNLQQCRAKNKQLIADNMRQLNEMRQQKGYNACLQTGKRYNKSKVNSSRRKTTQRQTNNQTSFKMPKLRDVSTTVEAAWIQQRRAELFSPISTQTWEREYYTGRAKSPIDQTATVESSMITNLQIGHNMANRQVLHTPNTKALSTTSKVASSHRPSHASQIGSVGSQLQRPKPSIFGQQKMSAQEEMNLIDAMNCKKIPDLVKKVKVKQNEKSVGTCTSPLVDETKQIHLHLDKEAEHERTEFSPFSLHMTGGVRDSLNVLSHRSRDNTNEINSSPADDGICTMRADSHLDAFNCANAGSIKKTQHARLSENVVSGAVTSHPQTAARQKLQHPNQAKSTMNTNKNIMLVAQSRENVPSTSTKPEALKTLPDVAETQITETIGLQTVNRIRVVSTAEAQSRNKAKLAMIHVSKRSKGAVKGENNSELSEGKVKISTLLEKSRVNSDGTKKSSVKGDKTSANNGSRTMKEVMIQQVNLDELDRWRASQEQSRELLLNGSDQSPMNTDDDVKNLQEFIGAIVNHEEFQRQKPRDALEIEFQVSHAHKPQTTNPDQNKRSNYQEKQEKYFQKGEFIAPRRNFVRKPRAKSKVPLNLLAMHDFKGTRNLDVSMINPDLVTSRHDTTETERLNYSTKTPEARLNRRISIHDPRLGCLMKAVDVSRPSPTASVLRDRDIVRRSPTPIKIVDLSAQPKPVPVPANSLSIRQDYLRHFPLLNRKSPLKTEHLRSMIAKGGNLDIKRLQANNTAEPSAVKHLSQSPHDTNENCMRDKFSRGNSLKDGDQFNLKAKVSYLVSSPITSPKLSSTMATTATFMPTLNHRNTMARQK